MKDLVVGVDLGGTSLMAVVADAEGKVLGAAKAETPWAPGDPGPVVAAIVAAVAKAAGKAGVAVGDLAALGVGVPGSVDTETGRVAKAVNLGWVDVHATKLLETATGLEAFAAGDVQVAVTGEHTYGAAKGARTAVAAWIGTGLGGGIIVDGQLYRGHTGAAGEIGHMVVLAGGPTCGCGRSGCAEALVSRSAIAREIMAGIAAGRQSAVPEILLARRKDRITAGIIRRALDIGDELVAEVLAAAQANLGVFVANLINAFDPEVVVLGGGLVEKLGEPFVAPVRVRAQAEAIPRPGGVPTRVEPSALGDHAGALGASVLARRRLALGASQTANGRQTRTAP